MMNKQKIKRLARLELARRELYYYAQLRAPEFYKDSRPHLSLLCNEIQSFIESDTENVLIIKAPPRHGKSRTAQLAVEWVLGRDKSKKIMLGSYNETLATQFSKGVRDAISEIKADENRIVYSDIFPDVKIKYGDGAMNLWSLEGGYNNYLATSPTGTATGFGADIMIIDDLIKNAMEANTAQNLENHWQWFINTMLSRLETKFKIIIIMTRWHTKDLAGRAMEILPQLGYIVRDVTLQALQPDGSMLCDEILSRSDYDLKIKTMGADIASANYQQTPIDIKGRLYSEFKTYDKIPESGFETIKTYVDTADQGNDYLCGITYGVKNGDAFIIDVYYTRDPMEITEKEMARRLALNFVDRADIESNGGGRGFARSVERILRTEYPTNKTAVKWFSQTKNKKARILTGSTWIMDHVFYPENWRNKWPEYYQAMAEYQREGNNAHDDAPDATTGISEKALVKKSNTDVKETIKNLKLLGL